MARENGTRISLRENIHVLVSQDTLPISFLFYWGVLKCEVSKWQPPDLNIFDTDPSIPINNVYVKS